MILEKKIIEIQINELVTIACCFKWFQVESIWENI